jgi:hypothetical protein
MSSTTSTALVSLPSCSGIPTASLRVRVLHALKEALTVLVWPSPCRGVSVSGRGVSEVSQCLSVTNTPQAVTGASAS